MRSRANPAAGRKIKPTILSHYKFEITWTASLSLLVKGLQFAGQTLAFRLSEHHGS
jgi:hypothetical protein